MTPPCILRNKLTGLYFAGTNFSASSRASTSPLTTTPHPAALRATWGDNAEIIPATTKKTPPAKTTFRKVSARGAVNDYVADLPSGEHVYVSVERKQSGDGVYARRKSWSQWSTFIHGKAIYGQGGITQAKREILKADSAHK
jgi:hypothetical protein